jgi:hypothetical protein
MEELGWTDQYYEQVPDAIPIGVGLVLTVEGCVQLAKLAESSGDFWKASTRWMVAAKTSVYHQGFATEGIALFKSTAAALEKVDVNEPSTKCTVLEKETLLFICCHAICCGAVATDFAIYSPILLELCDPKRRPKDTWVYMAGLVFVNFIAYVFEADTEGMTRGAYTCTTSFLEILQEGEAAGGYNAQHRYLLPCLYQLVRCAFLTDIYTQGCHWFPRLCV